MSISHALEELLGIPPSEHPVTYYRLLGIAPDEADVTFVNEAAYRQCMRVEAAGGDFPAIDTGELVRLIEEARQCLIDWQRRKAYDQQISLGGQREATEVCRLAEFVEGAPQGTEENERREWTLGTSPECDVVIDDPYVSRRHCRIVFDEGKYFVEDLGSSNGTYHNREPVVRRKEISLEDSIGLGKTLWIKWSQYITRHRSDDEGGHRPVIVHVARRTLRFANGAPVLPPLDSDGPVAGDGSDLTHTPVK